MKPKVKKRPRQDGARIYDGLSQAAVALGVSKSFLQWAKAQGAPGFRNTRIYADELEPWMRSHSEKDPGAASRAMDKRALECELLVERINALRMDSEKERGMWMLKSDFDAWQVGKAEQLKANLSDVFKRQMPPRLEGLRAPEIAAKMEEAIVQFVELFRKPVA